MLLMSTHACVLIRTIKSLERSDAMTSRRRRQQIAARRWFIAGFGVGFFIALVIARLIS